MAELMIALPSREELERALRSVNDNEHLKEHFIPRMTRYAGSKVAPPGLVVMLHTAMGEYARAVAGDDPHGEVLETQLIMSMDRYIDALAPDDGSRDDAKLFWRQLNEAAGNE